MSLAPARSVHVAVVAAAMLPLLYGPARAVASKWRRSPSTSKALDDALVKLVALACKTYPTPAALTVTLLRVATPATALTCVVPPSVADPGLLPRANVT